MNRKLRITIEGPERSGKTFLATLIMGMLKKSFTNQAVTLLEDPNKLDRVPAPAGNSIQIINLVNDFAGGEYVYEVYEHSYGWRSISKQDYYNISGPKRVIKVIREEQ